MSNTGHSFGKIVLLGFTCSGKSTVGAALARRMEWRFLDFDLEIERREGAPMSAVVAARGEEYLRTAEARLTREIEGERELVISPGGGWILQPDLLAALRPATFAAWLRVSAEEVIRRLRDMPSDHPLRDLADPLPRVAEMLADRDPLYRLADATFDADVPTPEQIAFMIEQTVRTRNQF
jgi:shikimate kinase